MAESRARRSAFFVTTAATLAAVVAIGFAKTFFIPLVRGEFSAAPVYYIHAALFFTWVVLFVLQTVWIRNRRFAWHRTTGWCAAAIVVPMAISLVGVGVATVYRDLDRYGESAVSEIVGTVTAAVFFVALVAAGIGYRRKPDIHRRLMLIATVSITWVAFFRLRRYAPWVPYPEVTLGLVLANLPIAVAMLYDRVARGHIPRVYWVAVALIAEQSFEVATFDSPPWRAVAHALFGTLG